VFSSDLEETLKAEVRDGFKISLLRFDRNAPDAGGPLEEASPGGLGRRLFLRAEEAATAQERSATTPLGG
jgi:hypothetical protein